MINYFTRDLLFHLIIFQSVLFLIIMTNLVITRRARRHNIPPDLPRVSVLVPARNEEHNISTCLHSLLRQDYPSFEVLVLDDQSSDRTGDILVEIQGSHPELVVLEGSEPPKDMVGKNWACSQLAEAAGGELLFFTDADTVHHPQTLMDTVTALLGEDADLVTGFPKQILLTWGERLLVPFFSWVTLAFIPLSIAYRIQLPALSMAVGQLMLFRKKTYQVIGGHSAVSSSIVDDLGLVRNVKRNGFRWRVISIADRISCRMYQNAAEARAGFVKNFFAAFDYRLLPFIFVMAWLGVMFWQPLVVLFLKTTGSGLVIPSYYLEICLFLSVLIWAIPFAYLRIPVHYCVLYPLIILANIVAGFQSIRNSMSARLEWKGRPLSAERWKWF